MKTKKITVVVPLGEHREYTALESVKKQKPSVNLFLEIGRNPPQNRNKGVKKAKTEFVAFINGHTILSDDWSKNVLKFFKEHQEIDIVGGPQLNHEKDSFFAKTSGYVMSSLFGGATIANRYKISKLDLNADESQLTSSNLICRKKVFSKVLFNESIYPGEDPKFISDAISQGFRVASTPSIAVYNKRRQNLKGFLKQTFNYGNTRPQQHDFATTLKKPLFFIPSLFVLYIVLFGFLSALHMMFIAPLILYILLSLFFSFYEAVNNKSFLAFFVLPIIFFHTHVAYGLGFLYGLVQKKRLPQLTDVVQ
ncbi:MAG: glycosyltransferase [Nanoarchaeota archaeon]|nr:glycosyltransferase [Nanoarchaeota archaeon]MBU1051204.1 glycosyltransferase [Nanoarchaeota archaeon]MBU1988143.1 glycosyltransferase [Nanoarchaeota archaeon]